MIPELTAALVIASAAVEDEDDAALVGRLQSGDETAFVELVRRYQPRLLRLAESTVGRGAVAQEVTQDTWLAVFRGVDRFEGRSSFKTWLFRILLNRARSAARREERAGRPDDALSDERFDANGAWSDPPEPWSDRAEDRLVGLPARGPRASTSFPRSRRRSGRWSCCATWKASRRPTWSPCWD